MTLNQRFEKFLSINNISQSFFSSITGLSDRTVSNVATGNVKQPKSDFFEALALHFPEWLFWVLTGEARYYPADNATGPPTSFLEAVKPSYRKKKPGNLVHAQEELQIFRERLEMVEKTQMLRAEQIAALEARLNALESKGK